MAMSFSPLKSTYKQPTTTTAAKPNPPKTLFSLRGGPRCVKCNSGSGNRVLSWSSCANYVKLQARPVTLAGVVKGSSKERAATFKCATIEEIEAEKSLIEKSVKEKMEKTIENVRSNFNSIRTGRSNLAMLDKVEISTPGMESSRSRGSSTKKKDERVFPIYPIQIACLSP